MPDGSKIIRLCLLVTVFIALSAMAGCPRSSDIQGNQRNDGPQDHSGPGMGGRTMGGMGM